MKIGVYISELAEEAYQGLYNFFNKKMIRCQAEKNYEIYKWHEYSNLMFQWMQMKQKNHSLTEYLVKYGYKRIAVYGIGDAGKLCVNEILQSTAVEILYIIDRAYGDNYRGLRVILPDDVNDEPDAIIITPVHCYPEIAENIYNRTTAKLISLEDMVVVLNEYEGQMYRG